MSHFTKLQTRMTAREHLLAALRDIGYEPIVGDHLVGGYGGQTSGVEVKVRTTNVGYDIGFRKAGDHYEIVADWWGIHGVTPNAFAARLAVRYAYHATRAALNQQGFSVVAEEVDTGDVVHLTLRRVG